MPLVIYFKKAKKSMLLKSGVSQKFCAPKQFVQACLAVTVVIQWCLCLTLFLMKLLKIACVCLGTALIIFSLQTPLKTVITVANTLAYLNKKSRSGEDNLQFYRKATVPVLSSVSNCKIPYIRVQCLVKMQDWFRSPVSHLGFFWGCSIFPGVFWGYKNGNLYE